MPMRLVGEMIEVLEDEAREAKRAAARARRR
jgi:hypothetical protein